MPHSDQFKTEAAAFAALSPAEQEEARSEQVRRWLKHHPEWALARRFAAFDVSPQWAAAYGPPESLQSSYEHFIQAAGIDIDTLHARVDLRTGDGID